MKTSRISLSQAISEDRLNDFVDQAERDGVGEVSEADFLIALEALVRAPHHQVKHRVHPLAMIRAESELIQITLHVLAADLDMR